jgi:hypothetical protein
MTLLVAIVGTVGLGAIIFVLVVVARLTQRWESVTNKRSYYRLFYVAAGLVGIASLARLIRATYLDASAEPAILADPRSWFYILVYHIPLTVAMAISLVVTWRNWGWLLHERNQ